MTRGTISTYKPTFLIDPMKLQFGDTLHMPTHHSVHGAKKRGYLFVGMARSFENDSRYPVFCTLQTSKQRGPCVLQVDPTTFCRPEVSIYTNPPCTKAPPDTLSDKLYLAGTRRIKRTKSESAGFLNLCQLAIVKPPPAGIPADLWEPQLSNDCLATFKEELQHLYQKHKDLYQDICDLYTISDEKRLRSKVESFKSTVKHLTSNADLRRAPDFPCSDDQCEDLGCTVVPRIKDAFRDSKDWSWRTRGFAQAGGGFVSKEATGIMIPFDVRGYELDEINFDRGRPSLHKRWGLVCKSSNPAKAPKPEPLKHT